MCVQNVEGDLGLPQDLCALEPVKISVRATFKLTSILFIGLFIEICRKQFSNGKLFTGFNRLSLEEVGLCLSLRFPFEGCKRTT